MPEDRPFTAQDLRYVESVCFVIPNPAVRRQVEEIFGSPNLGWRKIRFKGWGLVSGGVEAKGETGQVSGCPLVALEEIAVSYDSAASLPPGWQGDGDGEGGRGAGAERVPAPRVPLPDGNLEIEMVEVSGGTFLAWEPPEQPGPPPTVVVRGLDGSVREVVEEDEDPPGRSR